SGPLTASLDEVQKAFVLTGFYVLTGVHALHVIGGLIPLAAVTIRSFRNRYSSTDHAAVRYCAMYWHFLDGVWIVLFATLMLGT
ncbi:MAG: cytochrome c oxidase subunit 3, partial [Planctomycetota bacterium]|nr:cytochrome c oxidase subunit 3 [Planctomycetota bacterium]